VTAIVSAVLTAVAVSILLAGTFTGMALADAPAAVAVLIGMGVSGLFGAAVAYFRLRVPRPPRGPRSRSFRLPSLAGPALRLTAAISVVLMLWAVSFAIPPACLALTAALGTAGVLGALWCAVSARRGRAVTTPDHWRGEDDAILGGDMSPGAWEQAGQARKGSQR
jgi:hypothetical protein